MTWRCTHARRPLIREQVRSRVGAIKRGVGPCKYGKEDSVEPRLGPVCKAEVRQEGLSKGDDRHMWKTRR